MGVNSLLLRQRRGCDLNPAGPSAPESSTLTTGLPSHSPAPMGDLAVQVVSALLRSN